MKRTFLLLVILTLIPLIGINGQTKGHSSAQHNTASKNTAASGYYFLVSRCHACAVSGWLEEAKPLFQKAGLNAKIGDGYIVEEGNTDLPFKQVASFKWKKPNRNEAWLIPLCVGPFETEAEAIKALDKFSPIITAILTKEVGGEYEADLPKPNEKVEKIGENSFQIGGEATNGYGFFINGYQVK